MGEVCLPTWLYMVNIAVAAIAAAVTAIYRDRRCQSRQFRRGDDCAAARREWLRSHPASNYPTTAQFDGDV